MKSRAEREKEKRVRGPSGPRPAERGREGSRRPEEVQATVALVSRRAESLLSLPARPSRLCPPAATASSARTQKSARRCGGAADRRVMASDVSVPAPPPLASLSLLSGAYHRVDSAMLRSALLSRTHLGLPPLFTGLGWGWTLYKSRLLGLAPPPQGKTKQKKKQKSFDGRQHFLTYTFPAGNLSLFFFAIEARRARSVGRSHGVHERSCCRDLGRRAVAGAGEGGPAAAERGRGLGVPRGRGATAEAETQAGEFVLLLSLSLSVLFFFFACVHGDA